jgi:hypothetical protein
MKKMNKYTKELINFLNEKSNQGQNTISIPLQKRRKEFDSFMIHPIYKNSKIVAINVEKRVMPADTLFPIEILNLALELLSKADNLTLANGNAQKYKMGDYGLGPYTIEYIVAKEIYNKKDGESIDRRISVIANILIAANLCIPKKGHLTLTSK